MFSRLTRQAETTDDDERQQHTDRVRDDDALPLNVVLDRDPFGCRARSLRTKTMPNATATPTAAPTAAASRS